jgi:hypothetical protein
LEPAGPGDSGGLLVGEPMTVMEHFEWSL